MTEVSRPLSDDELNAYIDGEMPVDDLADAQRRLTEDLDALARAEEYRFQKMALRTLYARKLPSEAPDHLRRLLYGETDDQTVSSAPRATVDRHMPNDPSSASPRFPANQGQSPRGRFSRRPWGGYAVAATTAMLLLGASAVGGWIGHSRYIQGIYEQTQTQTFMNQAYSAYNLYSVGGEAETISEDRLRSVLTTLAENLGLTDESEGPSFMPPLSRDTFRLVSSEVIPVAGRVGAVFHYVDDDGQKVSLYVQPNWDQRHQFQNAIQREDIALQYRAEGMLAYALAAPAGLEGLPGLDSWLSGGD